MRIRNTQNRRRRAGFTLMEMMVVVTMIVALAGLGIFYMAGQVQKANEAKAKTDIKGWTTAVMAYKLNHPEVGYPATLQELTQKDQQGFGPYIQNVESLIDPWGQAYQYDQSGQRNGGTQPDIFTQIPAAEGGGIIGNWSARIQR
jgi:general secretion pathway protein G